MDASFANQIRARVATEKSRNHYPDGFPALPPIPAARYCDPAFFRLEREYVFGRHWLFVAHLDELPEPGDVVLLDQFPAPVILVRGEVAGSAPSSTPAAIAAHRWCRAARQGKTRLVAAITVGRTILRGGCAASPISENFQNLDQGGLGLGAVHCDTWAGLVFINFAGDAAPLRDFLAPIMRNLDDEIGDRVPDHQSYFVHKSATPLCGNWKLATDANLETYHVNTVHRESLSSVLDQKATAIWLLANGHSRMFNGQRYPLERNPAMPRFPHVNAVTEEGVYAYLIYPNTVFVISPWLIFTTQAWPLSPGEMRYDVYYLMAAPPSDQHRTRYERIIAATERILQEDLGNLPFMQNSIEAGALERIPLNYQERRIYHLHEAIDRSIGAELIPPRLRVPAILEGFIEQ